MRQSQIKTKGIILRRIDLKEADQIVTVLTRDEGRVGLLAKGSKRLKSKFLGKLELLNKVDLNYFQGRELGHLNEAEGQPGFEEDDLDLHTRSLLFYMAEATHKMTPEGQACQEVFELLTEALDHFNKQSGELVFYGYMVKLLTTLGFMQAWNESAEGVKLDLTLTHYLCERDGNLKTESHVGAQLSPAVIKWVSYMQQHDFNALKQVTPSHQDKVELFGVLKSILKGLFNYPFKSEGFLNQARLASD